MSEDKECCTDTSCFRIPIRAVDLTSIYPPIIPSGTIIPTINRYFYIVPSTINLINGITFPATFFTNDQGTSVTEFKTFYPNGYVNLYINAMMQAGGVYHVSPSSVTINALNGRLLAGTPIIVESLGFTSSQM